MIPNGIVTRHFKLVAHRNTAHTYLIFADEQVERPGRMEVDTVGSMLVDLSLPEPTLISSQNMWPDGGISWSVIGTVIINGRAGDPTISIDGKCVTYNHEDPCWCSVQYRKVLEGVEVKGCR